MTKEEKEIQVREEMVISILNKEKAFTDKNGKEYSHDELAEYVLTGKKKADKEIDEEEERNNKFLRQRMIECLSHSRKEVKINNELLNDVENLVRFIKTGEHIPTEITTIKEPTLKKK
jgi:hypothetical protein